MRTPFIPNGLVAPPPPYAEPPDLVSSAASRPAEVVDGPGPRGECTGLWGPERQARLLIPVIGSPETPRARSG